MYLGYLLFRSSRSNRKMGCWMESNFAFVTYYYTDFLDRWKFDHRHQLAHGPDFGHTWSKWYFTVDLCVIQGSSMN